MRVEPVALIATIVSVIQAIPLGLVIFGIVDWSTEQLAFTEAFIILVAAVPGTMFARSRVTPVGSLDDPSGSSD